jgi:hypothetical protein
VRNAEQGLSFRSAESVLRQFSRAVALVVLVSAAGSARAQTLQDGPPPQHRLVYRNALVLRLNPSGLIDDARISYRWRLYRSESVALRDNFIGVGLAPGASPAFGRLGAMVEVQPLTILQLYGIYEWVQYFGTFNFLQSFPSARSEFGDALLAERGALPAGDPARNYVTNGTQLILGANLQLKLGPIVARTQARLLRPDFKLREGDPVFYDNLYDVLAPNRGWFLTNDADVLYAPGSAGWVVGLRWTVTRPFYTAEHFAPGEAQENLNGMHRVGPLLAYTFFTRDGAAFNSPTLLLLAQWWVSHRYRQGQQVSALLPMIAVGLTFTGDLLPVKPAE